MPQISTIQYSQLSEYFGRIDAEFYKPVSLNADQIIKNQKYQKLGHLVSDGYRVVYESTKILSPEQIDLENDTRFLQATNISSDGLWIEVENIGYVSVRDWNRYPKGRIQHGEVLIEVKGQAEKVTIVQDYMPERTLVTGSVFKLTLKKNTISHEYLFAFFSSHYGKVLRDRTKVNTLIAYVSKPELYRIPIPIPNNEKHTYITNLIKESFNKQKLSKELYNQATQLLDDALGLKSIEFKKEKSYTASFSEVVIGKRQDADFYQPKYIQLLERLGTFELRPVVQFSEKLETGLYSSDYALEGLKYIRGTDIEGNGLINENGLYRTSILKPTSKSTTQYGDILVTRVGSIGVTGIVLSSEKMFFSDNLIRIRLNRNFVSRILPLYLLLFLKSKYGQMLMIRYSRGSVQQRLNQSQLGEIPIPILDLSVQSNISSLFEQSINAENESKELLEEAKQEVEILIEQAAQME